MTEGAWLDGAPAFQAWRRFVAADLASFTIPGHKRRAAALDPAWGRLLDADVPLFGGLDSVGLRAGVLAGAEQRAAQLWGADWCRFSTGGSTHANQAAALALGRPGDTVLVARTAHRSTISGLVLAGLRPVWLDSVVDASSGIPCGVPASNVRAALAEHPSAVGVLLVEPSYLGAVGDLAGVVEAAHERDVPVVVDQAWGAHLGFAAGYPSHALQVGADVLVTSAHKTLPAFSQAALVLARTARLDRDRLDRAFETSTTTSPAGAVLASIDACRALLGSDRGRTMLIELGHRAALLRRRFRGQGVLVPGPEHFAGRFDPAKVVLCLGPAGVSGLDLEAALVERGMPVEMADRDTVVPLVTLMDDDTTLERLAAAVEQWLAGAVRGAPRPQQVSGAWGTASPQVLSPREAFFAAHETVAADASVGRVSAELVAPYPPGVPVLVPGERITTAALDRLHACVQAGTRIAYAADPALRTLQVVQQAPDTPSRSRADDRTLASSSNDRRQRRSERR